MEERNESSHYIASAYPGGKLEVDSLVRDILRQWWVILLAALAAALIAGTVLKLTYEPEYTTSVTFLVSGSGVSSNTVSENLSAASALTDNFTTVVESDILKNRVRRSLGLSSLDAEITVSTVSSTNLMSMTVTADNPSMAYNVIRAVMDEAETLCGELADNCTIQVLQSPTVPGSASNPLQVRGVMIRVALLTALIMILLFALISYFREGVKSESDFRRKVDGKLLATIRHERKRKILFFIPKRKNYSLFIENPNLGFAYVEACRLMGTRVRREMDRRGAKVLLVTSVTENEGKSTVAANLAMALVQEGRRVILVDCDFRRPALYKIFELSRKQQEQHDLITQLQNGTEVRPVRVGLEKNLPVVFSTSAHGRLNRKKELQALSELLAEYRNQVDYIILDTSPLGLVSEGEYIAQCADASVLVVRQDIVEAAFINDTIDQLNETPAKVLGCVLNNVRTGVFNRSGSGYYGYSGYRYGRYGKYGGYGAYGNYSRSSQKSRRSDTASDKEV